MKKFLQPKFKKDMTDSGTQKFHAFITKDLNRVKTKIYSVFEDSETHRTQISPGVEDIPFEEIFGFVICAYDKV